MTTKSFLSQSIHTIVSKGLSLGLVFGAGIVTARWLGPEGKGVISLFQAVGMMIFPIAELGIRQSTAYFVGKDHSRAKEIYSNMQGIYFVVAALALGALFFAYGSAGLLTKYGWQMACVFAVVMPLALFESYHNGVFISKKQIERMNNLVMSDKLGTLIFLVLWVIVLKWDVMGAALAYLSARVVCFGLLIFWLKKEISFAPRVDMDVWKGLIKQGVIFSVALFVIQLNYRFSYLLLEYFKGTASVGIYSVGVSLAEVLKEIPLALGLVLFSRSANWKAQDIAESIKKVSLLSRLVFAIMLVVGVVWGLVAQNLIPLFYGQRFAESVAVTWLLLPGIVFLGVFLVLHTFMAGQGKPQSSIMAIVPALLVNLFVSWVLIPRYGFQGAAIGASISYVISAIVLGSIFTKTYKIGLLDILVMKREDVALLKARARAW